MSEDNLDLILGPRDSSTYESTTDDDDEDENVFPYEYIPCIAAVIIILLYSVAVRLAYMWDYKYINQGSLILLENKNQPPINAKSHVYIIIVDTGLWFKGGTNAHVRLEIHARNFCSRVYCLRAVNAGEKVLQRGNRDIFVLRTSDCLGEILSLTLLVITPEQDSTWYLRRIKILDISHNHKWFFPCNRWLSNDKRPNYVIKLFPHPSNVFNFKETFVSKGVETNTWLSVFLPYNRLGRLTRMERISICANTLMLILFTYVAIIQSDYWLSLDKNDALAIFFFVLICIVAVLLVIVFVFIPELILRNSVPILWAFKELTNGLHEIQCVDCDKRIATDSGVLYSEICPNYASECPPSPTCQICCKDVERSEENCERSCEQIAREFTAGKLNSKKRRARLRDADLITKYYDLASQYVRFFDTWSAFCDKFCDVTDELKIFMGINREKELRRHRKCLIWLQGGMEEIQEQFCMFRRNLKPETRTNIPENILYPTTSCIVEQVNSQNHNTIRLMRLTVFLMLIIIIDWLDQLKCISVKSIQKIPNELKAELHRLVFNLFYALDALVLKRNHLFQVCDKVLVRELRTVEEFIHVYLGNPGTADFELVRELVRHCYDSDWTTEEEEEIAGHKCGRYWNPLHQIRTHILNHTNCVVSEVLCGVIRVNHCRRPLSVFSDYMRYRSNTNEPLEWATICVDFTSPLLAVLIMPLVNHVNQFTGLKAECPQIQQYVQTVITNAALQALREIKCECSNPTDPPPEICPAQETDDICSEYAITVHLFRECLQKNGIVCQVPDECCPEGKVHIEDPEVLRLLLEEGKLTANQLACGQMVELMAKLIATYHSRLDKLEKFISKALLMFTDSEELLLPPPPPTPREVIPSESSSCVCSEDESGEFIARVRQEIQQMSFLIAKLLQRSKVQSSKHCKTIDIGDSALFWTYEGYEHQPFIQSVERYKQKIIEEMQPLTNPEIQKIQGYAFNIHNMFLSVFWTWGTYFVMVVQNCIFFALIVKWAERMDKIAGLCTIPVLVIAFIIEFFVAQPIKMLVIASVAKKYAEVSQNKHEENEKREEREDR